MKVLTIARIAGLTVAWNTLERRIFSRVESISKCNIRKPTITTLWHLINLDCSGYERRFGEARRRTAPHNSNVDMSLGKVPLPRL